MVATKNLKFYILKPNEYEFHRFKEDCMIKRAYIFSSRLIIFAILYFFLGLIIPGKANASQKISPEKKNNIKMRVVLPHLVKPNSIKTDGTQIYIMENEIIYIYSSEDFKLKYKFGKRGQGPQEFQQYLSSMKNSEKINLTILDEYLVVGSLKKISHFSKQGRFLKEVRMEDPQAFAVSPIGKGYIGVRMNREGFSQWQFSFNLYDLHGKKTKKLCDFNKPLHTGAVNDAGLGLVFLDELTKGPEYATHEDKIFISGGRGFSIKIFDKNGQPLPPINHEYQRIKISSNHRQKVLNVYRENLKRLWDRAKKIIRVPDYFPEFRTFLIADKKVFVQTYKKDKNKTEFLIFNTSGRFLNQDFYPIAYKNHLESYPYTIHKEKIYQLVENEEKEEWELIIMKIYAKNIK
jgi:hypothetical protein